MRNAPSWQAQSTLRRTLPDCTNRRRPTRRSVELPLAGGRESRVEDSDVLGQSLRNANSHADRHGHGCPSAPVIQNSGRSDLTATLHSQPRTPE